MNEADTEAAGRAVDSLLNFETVKSFAAEERESERYDRALASYADAAVQRLHLARHAQRRAGPSS